MKEAERRLPFASRTLDRPVACLGEEGFRVDACRADPGLSLDRDRKFGGHVFGTFLFAPTVSEPKRSVS